VTSALRHDCKQDELSTWGWTRHDGRGYGKQCLSDNALNVVLNTSFVNPQLYEPTCSSTASWAARVDVNTLSHKRADSENETETLPFVRVFWYFGIDCDGSSVPSCPSALNWTEPSVVRLSDENLQTTDTVSIEFRGSSAVSGDYKLEVRASAPQLSSVHEEAVLSYWVRKKACAISCMLHVSLEAPLTALLGNLANFNRRASRVSVGGAGRARASTSEE
jgi:hypothetical protein